MITLAGHSNCENVNGLIYGSHFVTSERDGVILKKSISLLSKQLTMPK